MFDDACLAYVTWRDCVNAFPACWPNIRCFWRSSMTLWATVLWKCMVRWRREGKKEKGLVRMDVCTWNYFRLQTWDVASFWTTCVDFSMSQSGQSIHIVFGDVFVGGSNQNDLFCVHRWQVRDSHWFYSPQNHRATHCWYYSRSMVWYAIFPLYLHSIPILYPHSTTTKPSGIWPWWRGPLQLLTKICQASLGGVDELVRTSAWHGMAWHGTLLGEWRGETGWRLLKLIKPWNLCSPIWP